ncbi:dihydropteroate synthase [bacterium]|nr:dihydropteroate synthase [bacterium]
MITVIAERINMTRKSIREKVWARDEQFVINEVKTQEAAGATHIDVNAGGAPDKELDDMIWLTNVVSRNTGLPLSFDSAHAAVLEAGLSICNRPGTIINSITAEKARIDTTLPLVTKFNTGVIALTMDDAGMPEDVDRRIAIADGLAAVMKKNGIALDRVYIDTLVRPVSTNQEQVLFMLDAIRRVKAKYPDIHCVAGLSNVSFGVPKRIHVNRAFFTLLLEAGLDAAIIDPLADGMMGTMHATLALIGRDEMCLEYIQAARAEKI